MLFLSTFVAHSQPQEPYWNKQTQLIPWRMVPVVQVQQIVDLDKDVDPDVIIALLNDSIPVLFIDDDDDMTPDRPGCAPLSSTKTLSVE